MKHFYILASLLISTFGFAQAPAGYYDSATGTGYTLKTQLHVIIMNGHVDNGYDNLHNGYATTDIDKYYENDNSILDIYSEDPSGIDPYNYQPNTNTCGNYSNEGDCFNREHLFPQGIFNSAVPMKNDIHHVVPTDGKVNGERGSFPFGEVASPDFTSLNGSKRGINTYGSYAGTVFEPIDEFKGDVARAMLYFATRYENRVAVWNHAMLNGTSTQVYADWFIALLVKWHTQDPVTTRETDRNNAAYAYQSNRNPFVDHPEYVAAIWNADPDLEAPTAPQNLVASNPTSSTIDLSWTASTDNESVSAYDVYLNGVKSYTSTTTNFTATSLQSETNYCFTVYAKDPTGNVSSTSNESCSTTSEGSNTGYASDLFFSEYVEGSGFNKALEIVNLTGSSVDLSNYSIKRNGNGSTTNGWDSNVTLSGTLDYGEVFVVINSDATDATLQAQADLKINNIAPMTFNGNDPVGLFKNNNLIDIIGTLGSGSADFAKDITLRRKNTVTEPNVVFNQSLEWDSYASNTTEDIGKHITTLNIKKTILKDVIIYPNPVVNQLFISLINNEIVEVEIFDVLGKIVIKEINFKAESINTSGLSRGIYILKLSVGDSVINKKFIKN